MSDTALSTCHLLRAPSAEGGRLLRGDESGERHLLYGCTKGIADIEYTFEHLTPTAVEVADIEYTFEHLTPTAVAVVETEYTYEFISVSVEVP